MIEPNRQQCKQCKYFDTYDDPAFIVNGRHFCCRAGKTVNDYNDEAPVCIDGYYWCEGICKYFERK